MNKKAIRIFKELEAHVNSLSKFNTKEGQFELCEVILECIFMNLADLIAQLSLIDEEARTLIKELSIKYLINI